MKRRKRLLRWQPSVWGIRGVLVARLRAAGKPVIDTLVDDQGGRGGISGTCWSFWLEPPLFFRKVYQSGLNITCQGSLPLACATVSKRE